MKFTNRLFNLCRIKCNKYTIEQKGNAEKVQDTGGTGPYSYDEAVELTGHGRYNYLQLAACCIIGNAVAVDMLGFGMVLAAASCDLRLGMFETAILASLPFTGILYSFPWGYFSDRCGRRRALLVCTSGGFLFAALASFSPNWKVMLVLKLFGYAFTSAGINQTFTYLGESTGNARRGQYLYIINSADLAAELVFYILAYLILPLEFSLPIPWLGIVLRPWRVYNLLLATPLGIGSVLLLMLHESPKFLASRGKEEMALKVLKTMFVANGGNAGEYPVKSLNADNVDDPSQSFWSSVFKQITLLFQPPLVWRTIQLFYISAVCACTNYVFAMWYPAIMNLFFSSLSQSWTNEQTFCQRVKSSNITLTDTHESGCDGTLSMNTIYCGIVLSLVMVILNLAASLVARYRRLLLQSTLVFAAVCLVLVDLVFDPIASMITFTMVQCTAIGIGSMASYFVDLYPTAYRSLVTGLAITTGQLLSLGGVNLVGGFIIDSCRVTLYGWTAFLCSAIMATFLLPADSVRKTNR